MPRKLAPPHVRRAALALDDLLGATLAARLLGVGRTTLLLWRRREGRPARRLCPWCGTEREAPGFCGAACEDQYIESFRRE